MSLNVESTVTHIGAQPPAAGHNTATGANSVPKEAGAQVFAKDQLKSIVQRIEQLEEEKKGIADDISDVFTEAKGNGFDVKALRTIVRMRKMDAKNPKDREEQEAILDTYMQAMGMI